MVVKKKKVAAKKPVKKVVKKTAVAKKVVKKGAPSAKKVVKKVVRKSAPSVKKVVKKSKASKAEKVVKKTSLSKHAAAKTKPGKKSVQKQIKPVVKKTAQKPIQRLVEKLSAKKELVKKSNKTDKKKMNENMTYNAIDEVPEIKAHETMRSKKSTTLLGSLEFTPYQPKVNETYMGDFQRDHFRKILNAWKQQLMRDVDLTVGHLKEEAVFYADPVDRASQEEGFNLELRTRDRERKLIKKIEQSLDLLNTGEFGFCEDCGAEIGIRRLEARPTAVKCIDCKTFQEIREKQLGG